MIGRSFLISWSRRWGPANMSISTANEVCITIIVNTSIVVVSSFIFSVFLWFIAITETDSIYTSQERSVTCNDRFRLSLILRTGQLVIEYLRALSTLHSDPVGILFNSMVSKKKNKEVEERTFTKSNHTLVKKRFQIRF